MLPMVNETQLLWEAAERLPQIAPADGSAPSHASMVELTAREGVDLATAVLYQWARREHRAFIDAVDAFQPTPDTHLPSLGTLLVAPAAGWRERPEYGGDGAVLRHIAEDLGMDSGLIELGSTASISANSTVLQQALAQHPPRSVILTTASKAAAELKVALREPGPHRDALGAWVNLGGLLQGTPLLDWGRRHRTTWWLVRLMMMLRQIDTGFIDGLSWRAPLLEGSCDVPEGVPVVTVVGFPLRSHLSGTIATRHGHLAPLGPNDGYGLLLDAMAPGHVYPVWGASHYLRTPLLSTVFYGIFAWLQNALE
ncbi:MAG: hypothetical protein KTR31_02075 [Myxococcales bacterium]|nr:hypothetical protein [Myxococcales bacterium]